jgi:UDP-N-acetylmuramyl pentapeptide phosphotransferase/UDP-N-acetylglucosamine-1-phosphate transferase
MTDIGAAYTASVAVLTLLAGLLYIRVWRARSGNRTPTGFGALLAPIVLGAAIVAGAATVKLLALGVLSFGTALYWIDDAIELPAKIRMAIALVLGTAMGALFIVDAGTPSLASWIGICLLAGLTCVVLTNLVNFYDGADLNLALYAAMTCSLVLLYEPADRGWAAVASAALAFLLPFAILNSRPSTIYLGDGGSFAFAGLLTALGTSFVLAPASVPPEAAIPSALPALDVAYVLLVRIAAGHDLLTRNWLHLYQQLNLRFRGFGYLLPQIANVALCLAVSAALQDLGLTRLAAVIVSGALVTVPLYFACRAKFVPRVIEPGVGEFR